MIRNYQRGSGGGSVDLGPIYSSINALQNEINSLITITDLSTLTSISADISGLDSLSSSVTRLSSEKSNTAVLSSSITDLSTSFTYHVQVQYLASNEFKSSVKSSISSISSSITNISSSVLDINSIVSSLSSDIRCCKTLTNPTESGYLFTDPVLYSGPNIDGSTGFAFNNVSNTYMKGVTWKDYPVSVTSLYGTAPAFFSNCVVYGDFSLDNVYKASLLSNTVTNLIINGATGVSVNNGSYNSISVNRCITLSLFDAYIYDFISPNCYVFSCDKCRIKDISYDYPSTLSVNNIYYRLSLNSNTIDRINASALKFNATRNDIWTANLYFDYDVMQTTADEFNMVYMSANTINELSIFNNEHGMRNTTNNGISRNVVYLNGNNCEKLWINLLCPCTVLNNTIETFNNIVGVLLTANYNEIQEWDCEISPYSAYLHNTSTTNNFAMINSNTINKWNLYHGFSQRSILNNSFLFNQLTAANDLLPIYALYNTVSYATFDMLNSLSLNLYSHILSAFINVANDMTVAVSGSIGTLNMVKNEGFVTTTLGVNIGAFSAHSLGATNIYPDFSNAGASINLFDMYIDDGLLESYTLNNITIDKADIKYFATSSTNVNRMNIYSCSIDHLNYEQNSKRYINLSSNTMNYCNIIGGGADCYKNRYRTMNIVVESAGLYSNSVSAFGGTCLQLTAHSNSLNVGAFYCSTATVSGGTIVRLNTAF